MTKGKKSKTVEDVVEEVAEEGIEVKVVSTMVDPQGRNWEIDADGNKLRRI
jgi:hypothetical protein